LEDQEVRLIDYSELDPKSVPAPDICVDELIEVFIGIFGNVVPDLRLSLIEEFINWSSEGFLVMMS
jgi:hypothetical protein